MADLLDRYAEVVGQDVISHLRQLAAPLKGMKVVHVNSTKEGGGVAEILHKLIPLKNALGIKASWEVITGTAPFYQCTKMFHNAVQGHRITPSDSLLAEYEKINAEQAEIHRTLLEEADVVFIHDPQPAGFLRFTPNRRGKWIWRCHVDVSKPHRPVWRYIRDWVKDYDASIFSLPQFAKPLPHPQYLIAPSIDPLSDKNKDLRGKEIHRTYSEFGLDPGRPIICQVSRFDKFKDPVGVIAAYKMARRFHPLQLVLVGGGATDDPEGQAMFEEVKEAAGDDPDIHVILLPPDAHKTINALQRISDIVLQKSLKEGFGLTVTEALWKGRPVIGGDVGGIRLQIINHVNGFLVNTPEGAALRIRYLLQNRNKMEDMGRKARWLVKENFLLTRHLREYLSLMIGVISDQQDRIKVGVA